MSAASIRIAWFGAAELRRDLAIEAGPAGIRGRSRTQVEKAATVLENQAVRNIIGSRTRAKFRIVNGRRVRRKPPGIVTARPDRTGIFEGRLRQSASHKVTQQGATVNAEVGFSAIYAEKQENMRSFLGLALGQTREPILDLIGASFRLMT